MARLEAQAKRYAVVRLATFIKQTQIIAEVEREFGVTMTRDQLSRLDPTNASAKVGDALTQLFHEKRAQYLTDEAAIPIAHRVFRLQQLNEMLLEEGKMPTGKKEKRAILEQAAKEMGGMYEQKQVGASPAEVDEYVADKVEKAVKTVLDAAEEAVKDTVTNPQEQGDAVKAIKERLASKSRPDG